MYSVIQERIRSFSDNVQELEELHIRFGNDVIVDNMILAAYARQGNVKEAKMLFDAMQERRDIVSWNSLMSAYVKLQDFQLAKSLFDAMPARNIVSWNSLLNVFAQCGEFVSTETIFMSMPETSLVSWTTMLHACAQAGRYEDARIVFSASPESNIVLWNAMVTASTRNGHLLEAKRLLDRMPEWDKLSWTPLLQSYASCSDVESCEHVFDLMPERDIVAWTTLLQAHARKGDPEKVKFVLMKRMPVWSVSSWNILMGDYLHCGLLEEASAVFMKMPGHDSVSHLLMVMICSRSEDTNDMLASLMPNASIASWNALISAHAERGHVNLARRAFLDMPFHSCVSWTTMLGAYVQTGHVRVAEILFREMPERDMVSWNAMLAAYIQVGKAHKAEQFFCVMPEKDQVSWNTMAGGVSPASAYMHGMEVNVFSFSSLLSKFSQAGLVEDARLCFRVMVYDAGLAPLADHYHTMVDVLGRASQLENAEKLIDSMPYQPDSIAWYSLLGACSTHLDIERGERAARHLLSENPGAVKPLLMLETIRARLKSHGFPSVQDDVTCLTA